VDGRQRRPRSWRRHVGAAITFEIISDADMSRIAQAMGTSLV
jgi:hypothetical protein